MKLASLIVVTLIATVVSFPNQNEWDTQIVDDIASRDYRNRPPTTCICTNDALKIFFFHCMLMKLLLLFLIF